MQWHWLARVCALDAERGTVMLEIRGPGGAHRAHARSRRGVSVMGGCPMQAVQRCGCFMLSIISDASSTVSQRGMAQRACSYV